MRGLGVRALALAALVVAALVGRVLVGARLEYARGVEAERAAQLDRALSAYRRCIGWYVPGNPYGVQAIQALERISLKQEQAGNLAGALAAERAVVAGLESARSFYVPHGAALAAARQRVAALVARRTGSSIALAPELPADPSAMLSLTAFLGWLGFVGSAAGLIVRGADAEGRLHGAARWCGGLVAGALVFALSLWLA
jgi:hypothetical protein